MQDAPQVAGIHHIKLPTDLAPSRECQIRLGNRVQIEYGRLMVTPWSTPTGHAACPAGHLHDPDGHGIRLFTASNTQA